ncbi:DUF2975 domain-containing protein [Candidatus Formimonas warabiya]|uniref:DUF2975 domain-containing protein n=1 Tax=Formimonas warabiya TaxID=1761012 RepID=A0A3G1KTF2_FORW1|nr:DUF2975 domain-containing protein [Candidatus Formimonas warabiya]ATW25435.1 hypothetical protein DCMF_12200 [Candidatus Formimonas warabiya]
MWNGEKSISLSKFCVLIFMCLLIVIVLSAPWLTHWFLDFSRADLKGTEPFFLATIYTGFVPAAYLLYSLLRLLHRIEAGQVFITENVEHLRRISWSSFAGAAISFVSVFYYFPWVFVVVAAAFMGLIVRVVKNVVAQAVALQNEVDYTV